MEHQATNVPTPTTISPELHFGRGWLMGFQGAEGWQNSFQKPFFCETDQATILVDCCGINVYFEEDAEYETGIYYSNDVEYEKYEDAVEIVKQLEGMPTAHFLTMVKIAFKKMYM